MAEEHKQTAAGKKRREEGQRWLARIKDAEALEKKWIDDADQAVKIFGNEGPVGDMASETTSNYDFNILFSNVETIVPAIINSPPSPDIRRRFGDTDEAAKDFAELIERAISVQVDDSRLQIELEACAQDGFLAGRGVVRIRFKADINGEPEREEIKELAEDERSVKSDDGEKDTVSGRGMVGSAKSTEQYPGGVENAGVGGSAERIENERCAFEAVSWRDYRHGPAKRWEDRKWDAFRHSMPQEDVDTFQDPELVSGQMTPEDRAEVGESDTDIVVWEVWCRKTRKVKFIRAGTGVILKMIDDPLGLSNFFPIATPVQPVEITGRLMPVNPFAIYRHLAAELDDITKRINVLIKAMRVKGWYAGDATDLDSAVQLDDDEFTPITNAEQWAAHGGIENAIAFWPVEKYAAVIKELYAAREQTKQAIYEITGISDIVRGASKASETLGAQEIKSQWGSLRIQKAQRSMERCARDLFVMMSEIIPSKFTPQTLQRMTGIQLIPTPQDLTPVQPQIAPGMPPEAAQQAQAQAQEAEQERVKKLQNMQELNRLMQEPVTASYRVDVETDSTVRADLTRQKQEVSEFLQGSGAYFQAVGPLVQEGVLPADVAIEIYASNARMFNLGKATEDAIDSMIETAKKAAKQPPPPDPEQIKAQAEAQAKQQEQQFKQQSQQADMQIKGMEAKLDMQQAQMDFAAKTKEMQDKMQLEMVKSGAATEKAKADIAIAQMSVAIKELELEGKKIDLEAKKKEANRPKPSPQRKKAA